MPSLSQTHKSCMTLFFYLFSPIQKSVQWNKDLLVSGLQQYRKAWSPGFVFVMGNYYTATYANFSWNCLFFHRLYSNWNSLPMCSIHYHFLHYSSEFLTALFDLAYELSHPPKSTLMICHSTNQLSSKCLISLWQKSLFMQISKKVRLTEAVRQSVLVCPSNHLSVCYL